MMVKFIPAVIATVMIMILSYDLSAQGCCTANAQFAALGNISDFRFAHEMPRKQDAVPELGRMITFKTAGKEGTAYAIRPQRMTNKWLIVIHEWWGLNDNIKLEADRYYRGLVGVNVLALDLYDGQVATNRDNASRLMQETKAERIREIIDGALKFAGSDAEIVSIGWCFGGGWSLQTALMGGDNMAGCVMYYGMPERRCERLRPLQADVLAIFAEKDQWITPSVAGIFKNDMESEGKSLIMKMYDADHAFANPSSPRYNESAATEANRAALAYIKERLNSN
ncbi:MAG TPA: dienelactone hydrolase [Flavobacteriales bacterium]|jgi:carboxymethylenebutenolidase|nr:dienelactone hydrolase [Flavobacteriales bacterium]